ncbi:MAG: hypothetical protein J6Q59_06865 [Paludibacteraceae bacterium]|nr:hypothetical protein [Paludibacteraceae bacterium]
MNRDGGLNVRKRTKELLNYAILIVGLLWFFFVGLPEVLGKSNISWSTVLLLPFAALAIVHVLIFFTAYVAEALLFIKRKYRARKRDARIIAQAKASGAWYTIPTPLGGRALELYAWHNFRFRRRPGETDAELRKRCDAKTFVSLIVGEAEKALEKRGGAE